MRRTFLALLALASLLALRPAAAWQWELRAGGGGLYCYTQSLDALTASNTVSGASVFFAGQLYEGLYGEIGYAMGRADGRTFDDFRTELRLDRLVLAVRYDLELLSFLNVFARAGGELAWGALELKSGAVTLRDEDQGPAAQPGAGGFLVGLGTELYVPRKVLLGKRPNSIWRDFTVGFRLELGYEALFGLGFDELQAKAPPARNDKELPMLRNPLDLGALSLHGWTLHASAVVHF